MAWGPVCPKNESCRSLKTRLNWRFARWAWRCAARGPNSIRALDPMRRLDQPMYQDSVLGSIEPSLSEVLGVKPVADFDNDDSLSSSGSSSSSCSSSGEEEERDPPDFDNDDSLSSSGSSSSSCSSSGEEERAGSPRDAAASGSQW
eukprot:CAMPEP_0172940462 /NCGR_PEP_ID=MMETSP1075-20121228/224046_1 /TAXON_ID=2916 /ORGANISM="Ceratium fusus, Strain PA161109" /LENGTH=145 /DNA_ID=CAMNT_0013801861 /DNA_START=438 /DNA_END=874 /DNA_ORIENTATION=+